MEMVFKKQTFEKALESVVVGSVDVGTFGNIEEIDTETKTMQKK